MYTFIIKSKDLNEMRLALSEEGNQLTVGQGQEEKFFLKKGMF